MSLTDLLTSLSNRRRHRRQWRQLARRMQYNQQLASLFDRNIGQTRMPQRGGKSVAPEIAALIRHHQEKP